MKSYRVTFTSEHGPHKNRKYINLTYHVDADHEREAVNKAETMARSDDPRARVIRLTGCEQMPE